MVFTRITVCKLHCELCFVLLLIGMANRIILCGASSVGKTTVATEWCKLHKQYYHIQEVARDVMKKCKLTREDMKNSLNNDPNKEVFLNLQRSILIAQNQHEVNIPCDTPYISDRGPDPIVFAYVYGDLNAAKNLAESSEGKQCLERYKKCLVVLLCPLKSPTDDNFRFIQDMEQQQRFTDGTIFIFHQYKIPYVYIDELNHEKRMRILNDAVNGTLVIHSSMLQDKMPVCISFSTKKKPADILACIRSLIITTNQINCQYCQYDTREKDRMVDRYGASKFVQLEFDKNVPAKTVHFLTCGMYIDGEEYQFIGCSQGGIKKRHCYMFKGSVELVEKVLAECGQFNIIKSASKRLKRIGLLFSKATPTEVAVAEEDVIFVDDIENRNGIFTDGCGNISRKLAKAVAEGAGLDLEDYLPSVYQIRYNGCKGVVSVDPDADGLILRKSMKKFESGTKPFNSIWLCDYSKPYSYGKLNKQFIMLLSGLGINDQIFLNKQQQFFEMIDNMTTSSEVATKFLFWNKEPGLAIKCQKHLALQSNKELYQAISRLKDKYINKLPKLSIFIEESRQVFGVCDQLNILEYGQCFFRPTLRGKPYTITGEVVIAKNPCYLLGDVRVLKAIDIPELHHLIDCIVFPTKGKQPHPNEIAGSDLDGDKYFVCWDEQLIPRKLREPYSYPSVENRNIVTATRETTISYLSKQNQPSSMMGKINNNFQYFAALKGVDCTECEQLGKLFSRSVDQTKTGDLVKIPKHLQRPIATDKEDENTIESIAPDKIWLAMQQKAENKKKELANKVNVSEVAACSEKFIWYLVEESSVVNDFKLFLMAQKWCQSQYSNDQESLSKLLEFSQYIDFGKMNIHERITVMDAGIPKELVTNSLNWSKLLTSEMLNHFSMQSPECGWHCYLSSSSNFQWIRLMQALQKYEESFIVVDLGDGLISALHFSCSLSLGESAIPPGSITAYLFSSHFNYKEKHILGKNYYVNLEDDVLQLYRNNNKAQTFIWLRSEAKSKEGEIIFDRMSIDLQTYPGIKDHPKVNKQTFHSIEVFVRDLNGIPTYFDIYNTNQSLNWNPKVIVCDDIDEFSESHIEKTIQKIILPKSYSLNDYLEIIKQTSKGGDCKVFLEALKEICDKETSLLPHQTMLCTCLNVLLIECVTKNAHKSLRLDEIEALQVVITELHSLITDPLVCVQLLSSLSRLRSPDLLKQVLCLILPCIQLNEVSSFMNVCLLWKLWYFIPLETALKILKQLFILHQSVISTHIKSSSTDDCTILELATNMSSHVSNDPVKSMYYSSHFACLSLNHLLHEMANKKEITTDKAKETSHNLIKLSADDTGMDEDDRETDYKRVEFHRSENIEKTSISKYTWVSINLMAKEGTRTISTPVAVGQVVRINNVPACIVVDVHKPVPSCLIQSVRLTEVSKRHWELCNIGNVIVFTRAIKCLNNISNGQVNTDIVSLLVHPSGFQENDKQIFQENLSSTLSYETETFTNTQLSPTLNCSQQKAVKAALTQRLTLIHGPPGTGKTLLACQIVKLFCNQLCDKEFILVTAETNMAVDNLTRKLLEHNIKVVRIGRLDLISNDIHNVTLEQQKVLSNDENHKSVVKTVMASNQVIATTCTGAADLTIKQLSFPYVVIDEATQVTEPNSLIPLMNGCRQATLIGDPAQLSPTLSALTSDNGDSLPQVKQLKQTLFHRLQKVLPPYFLNEQYRMHPMIAEFPSTTFYDGKLNSAQVTKERTHIKSPLFNKQKPVMFIDVPSKETPFGKSFKNEKESDVVRKLVAQLIEDNINPSSIAVLTPYAAQVMCIRECLTVKSTEVCTIDAFQGREKDVIIFSTVRCNSHGSLGFIDDKYRMNVLLTRAKRGIIGVGCKETLSTSPLWKKWLQQSKVLSINTLSSLLQESYSKPDRSFYRGQGTSYQKVTQHKERSGQHNDKKYSKKQASYQRRK